jgi:hypothetical protein
MLKGQPSYKRTLQDRRFPSSWESWLAPKQLHFHVLLLTIQNPRHKFKDLFFFSQFCLASSPHFMIFQAEVWTLCSVLAIIEHTGNHTVEHRLLIDNFKSLVSEGRFELPPTEVDCDLNAAP